MELNIFGHGHLRKSDLADGAARIKGYEVEGLKCSGTARRPEGLEQNEVVQRAGAEMRFPRHE